MRGKKNKSLNNIQVCHSSAKRERKEILEGKQLCWYIKESIHLLSGFFKVTCSAASIGDFSWGLFQTNWLWYSEFLGKVFKREIFMPAFLWRTLWSWQREKRKKITPVVPSPTMFCKSDIFQCTPSNPWFGFWLYELNESKVHYLITASNPKKSIYYWLNPCLAEINSDGTWRAFPIDLSGTKIWSQKYCSPNREATT